MVSAPSSASPPAAPSGRGARLRWALKRVVAVSALGAAALALAVVVVPFDRDGLARPLSTVLVASDGTWLHAELASDEMWRTSPDGGEIPPHLIDALLSYEDKRFYYHPGVDPIAIVRATLSNLSAGRVVSGGSTITMQVARMMDRGPRRFSKKLQEAFVALQLEWHLDKDEILAAYFQLAPYGGNVEGAATAARGYFKKALRDINLNEAALLAVIPNAPTRLRPSRPVEKNLELLRRRNMVLRRMQERGLLTLAAMKEAQDIPLRAYSFSMPRGTFHVARRMAAYTDARGHAHTHVTPRLQRLAERHLKDYVAQQLKPHGVSNAAVVVVDNASAHIVAYAGSADFWDNAAHGQVDGARGWRSPGSTLKPFLYARALDRGLIGASTMIPDVPVDYSGYAPDNFDGKFHGHVMARDALASSLNIPAVILEDRLGKHGVRALLRQSGVSTFRDQRRGYGLSTVVGGCEMTLWELTGLYSVFAKDGVYHAPQLFVDEVAKPAQTLFSPEAAYLVADVLTDVKRPDMPAVFESRWDMPKVAWKTGTSYGYRDAWSVGLTRRYTVGIWVGNMDGTGNQALIGSKAAAPLLFNIMNAIEDQKDDDWLYEPKGIVQREVCAQSGMLPHEGCAHTRFELAINDVAPVGRCSMHQTFLIDDETGTRLCPHCRHGRAHHEVHRFVWPPEVLTWAKQEGVWTEGDIPPHAPFCTEPQGGAGPNITAPRAGDHFLLRADVPAQDQSIALVASSHAGTAKLYWFVDGRLLATTTPGERLMYVPEPGAHQLVVVDDEGRSHSIDIDVREDA